jgi:PKD repeat protein
MKQPKLKNMGIIKTALLLLCCMMAFGISVAQISVTATAGTTTGSYANLNAALGAINTGTHQGVITISVTGNTIEPSPPTSLVASGAGAASYTSINISPSSGSWTINSSAVPLGYRGIIELFGAQHVTIDGDPMGTGQRQLTFQMVQTSDLYTSVIRFGSTDTFGLHGTAYDTIRNCNIIGGNDSINSTASGYGILTSGNSISSATAPAAYGCSYNAFINNTFSRCSYALYLNGAGASLNSNTLIRGNYFLGSTADTSNKYCIYLNAFNNVSSATLGTIDSNDFTATGNFSFSCIYDNYAVGPVIVCNNNIHDANGPSVRGYYAVEGTVSNYPNASIGFYDNVLQDCNSISTQSSYLFLLAIPLLEGITGNVLVHNNSVNNISGVNFTAITSGFNSTACYNNTITNINGIGGIVTGLEGSGIFYNNTISGLSSTGSTSGSYGILLNYGSVFNNMISNITANPQSANATLNTAIGIYTMLDGPYSLIYENTIALNTANQSGSAQNGFSAAIYNTGYGTFRDNIIYNNQYSTNAYGIYVTQYLTSDTLDYNEYYVPYGNIGYTGAASEQNLQSWQAATGVQDIHSASGPVPFISVGNLHIDTTNGYAANVYRDGTYLTAGPTDINGRVRNNPPCIGAEEFNAVNPVAHAGSDQIVCIGGEVVTAAIGPGTWTSLANPAVVSFGSTSAAVTSIIGFSVAGTYRFVWTSGASQDTLNIYADSVSAYGISNKLICDPSKESLELSNNSGIAPFKDSLWYAYSITGLAGAVSMITTSLPTVFFDDLDCSHDSVNGNRLYIVLVRDSAGCPYEDFTGTSPTQIPCSSSAGLDQTICEGSSAVMAATGIGIWSAFTTNPTGVIIANTSSPTTMINGFSQAGIYSFLWTTGTGSDTVPITVNSPPTATVTDDTICSGATAMLTATGGTTYVWSFGGDTTASINTTIAGTYTVTVSSTGCATTATASGTVTVNPAPIANYSLSNLNDTLAMCPPLTSIFTDNSSGSICSYSWSFGNGNTSNIADPTALYTIPGNYPVTEIITACNGCADTITKYSIRIHGPSVALAASQAVSCPCTSVFYTLTPNLASDSVQFNTDGGNPAFKYFARPSQSDTITVTYCNTGYVRPVVTVFDSIISCSVINDSLIEPLYVTNNCPSAGPDQTICQNSTITMAATGTGSWTALPGNPATVTIDTPSLATTHVSGFILAGIYGFSWGTSAGDTMYVTVGNIIPVAIVAYGATCYGGSNGSVMIAVGASGPFDYTWSPAAPDADSIGGLAANTYCVTVTGIGNGCSATACAFVSQPGQFVVSTDSLINPTCPNGGNGRIIIISAGGTPPYNYTWSPIVYSLPDPYDLSPGVYCLTATDANGCTASLCDTVTLLSACPTDTIWPGDADANHIVDNNDLLPIGLGYDSAGPARTLAQQGIVWQADSATSWAQYFTSYTPAVNFNHADCNGDGTINALDTLAILQNFGLTYQKASIPSPWRSGLPPLYPKITEDTVTNGDTLSIYIILGDTNMAAQNVYGLAYTLNFDATVIDTGTATLAYPVSWLGSATDKISISHIAAGQGVIKTAVTRIDHTTRSGAGPIAAFRAIVTTDNIDGKDLHYYQFRCSITDVRVIDSAGNIINVNEGTDSNEVAFTPLGITAINDLNSSIILYPNPAKSFITIASAKAKVSEIDIINVLGETISQSIYSDSKREHIINIQTLSSGIYYAIIKTNAGTVTRKVTINE